MLILMFTWFFFLISVFILFMVFMNFIIAVISDQYQIVIEHKVGHDYKQRVRLIYEREVHLSDQDFDNPIYFPNILIVRKQKKTDSSQNNFTNSEVITSLKSYIKAQNQQFTDLVNQRTIEQKNHLTNSILLVENDV